LARTRTSSSAFRVILPTGEARERLRLNLTARAALADDTHQEITELIVQPLDVSQQLHERMVTGRGRPCSVGASAMLYYDPALAAAAPPSGVVFVYDARRAGAASFYQTEGCD